MTVEAAAAVITWACLVIASVAWIVSTVRNWTRH
jgi:hypothetical protein